MDLKLQIYVKIFSVYQLYVHSIEYMYIPQAKLCTKIFKTGL